jgi:hypothetical protein
MNQPGEYQQNGAGVPLKQNLFTLMIRHGVLLLDLARESQQHPLVIWGIITGHPVKRNEAIQVIQALNALRQTDYTCENLVLVVEEENYGLS